MIFSLLILNVSAISCSQKISSEQTIIEDSAYKNCIDLEGPLEIPKKIVIIGNYSFYGCINLKGPLIIPSGVKTIGDHAFEHCISLTGSLTIPDSVTYIGEKAFYECKSFTGPLIIPETIKNIGKSCFEGCINFNTLNFTISNESKIFYYASIYIIFNILPFSDLLLNKIEDYAFFGCTSLKTVTFDSNYSPKIKHPYIMSKAKSFSLKIIGDHAFH